jgi:hypothetical protein
MQAVARWLRKSVRSGGRALLPWVRTFVTAAIMTGLFGLGLALRAQQDTLAYLLRYIEMVRERQVHLEDEVERHTTWLALQAQQARVASQILRDLLDELERDPRDVPQRPVKRWL